MKEERETRIRFRDALGDWLDCRTGYREALRDACTAPGDDDSVVAYGLGAAIVGCLAVLALSGVALMTTYSPSPQTAWASVHYIQFVEAGGWLLRGLHFWSAQLLLGLAAARVLHGLWVACYRPPREIAWWLTLAVVFLTLVEAITGGLLPWDQRGWWARFVEVNFVGRAPLIGVYLQRTITGGPALGALALTRAYTLHVVVLPAAFAIAVASRRRVRRRTTSPSDGALGRAAQRAVIAAALVSLAWGLAIAAHGAPLDAPGDSSSDYPARPEWFLLPLYELRGCFEGPAEFWGTAMIPAAAAAYFALLPAIDRPGTRRRAAWPAAIVFAATLALGLAAFVRDRRDTSYAKARRNADTRAALAIRLAMSGVPPAGPLEMMRADPELRGQDVFARHCASCHAIADLGDRTLTSAATLDGWGTVPWIEAMLHDPDGSEFFGRGPYKGRMPSVDSPSKEKARGGSPLVRSPEERHAIAVFLSSQGDDAHDAPSAVDAAARALGETIVNERCAKCHLYKGGGDDDGSGFAPELSGYGSLAWTIAQVRNPATPKTYRDKALDPRLALHMPRFDTELSETDIAIVAHWIRTHGRSLDRSRSP